MVKHREHPPARCLRFPNTALLPRICTSHNATNPKEPDQTRVHTPVSDTQHKQRAQSAYQHVFVNAGVVLWSPALIPAAFCLNYVHGCDWGGIAYIHAVRFGFVRQPYVTRLSSVQKNLDLKVYRTDHSRDKSEW